jgi:hypothetical protein
MSSTLSRLEAVLDGSDWGSGLFVVNGEWVTPEDIRRVLDVVGAASRDADPSFELAMALDRLEKDK